MPLVTRSKKLFIEFQATCKTCGMVTWMVADEQAHEQPIPNCDLCQNEMHQVEIVSS